MSQTITARVLGLCLFLSMSFGAQAQTKYTKYYEFGLGLASMNMRTEISSSASTEAFFKEMRPQLNLFGKRHFNDWFTLGAEMSFGWMYANDANHGRPNRGLSVNTFMFNSHAFTEIHLIRFGKWHRDRPFTLFLKGGVGYSGWNPEIQIEDLVPDNVDIQSQTYSGLSYYGGMGVKFRVSYTEILTIEGRIYDSGGNNMEGFILTDQVNENDRFGGLMISYSRAIF